MLKKLLFIILVGLFLPLFTFAFGYNSIGGIAQQLLGDGSGNGIGASLFTAEISGTINSIKAYTAGWVEDEGVCAIYTEAGTKIAETGLNFLPASPQWETYNFSEAISVSAGVKYFLACMNYRWGGNGQNLYFASEAGFKNTNTYSGWGGGHATIPDLINSITGNQKFSIYADIVGEPQGNILTISGGFATSMLAYAGQIAYDFKYAIFLMIGLPIGFWLGNRTITLLRKQFRTKR